MPSFESTTKKPLAKTPKERERVKITCTKSVIDFIYKYYITGKEGVPKMFINIFSVLCFSIR